MNNSKLYCLLISLLGTLSTSTSAQYGGLTGGECGPWCDRQMLVNTAQLIYQWYLENRPWRTWRKRPGIGRVGPHWAGDYYDAAGANIYIPFDYGDESWFLRPRTLR